MNALLITVIIGFLGIAVGLFCVFRKLTSAEGALPVTAGWIDELSGERYRPMMQLLNTEDLAFLQSQPGFNARKAYEFRVQRCEIFLDYLRSLTTDFRRVCMALKIVLLHSREDRPDLSETLLRQQFLFSTGLVLIYFRLSLYRYLGVTLTANELVRIFDGMRIELQTLLPATMGMEA